MQHYNEDQNVVVLAVKMNFWIVFF